MENKIPNDLVKKLTENVKKHAPEIINKDVIMENKTYHVDIVTITTVTNDGAINAKTVGCFTDYNLAMQYIEKYIDIHDLSCQKNPRSKWVCENVYFDVYGTAFHFNIKMVTLNPECYRDRDLYRD